MWKGGKCSRGWPQRAEGDCPKCAMPLACNTTALQGSYHNPLWVFHPPGMKGETEVSYCPILLPFLTSLLRRHPGVCPALLPEVGVAGLSGTPYPHPTPLPFLGPFCCQGLSSFSSMAVQHMRSGLVLPTPTPAMQFLFFHAIGSNLHNADPPPPSSRWGCCIGHPSY